MSKRVQPDKFAQKKEVFLERIQRILPSSHENIFKGSPLLSVRINTLKPPEAFFAKNENMQPITWAPDCYWFNGNKQDITHSSAFSEGNIYLQNAASFIPPLVLDPQPGEVVLDMCAAPGGKASHIAALTGNKAELWVNDNSRPRQARMHANFERLGVVPHKSTLYNLSRLNKELPSEYFDKIMLDAPCSGEGMLDITSRKDFTYWSVAHIKRLSSLQKQAIATAWELLKPGGRLVYSTCTIAPEENEAVIDYLLRRHNDALLEPIKLSLDNAIPALSTWNNKAFTHDLSPCLRLTPSKRIEAFFVASIKKIR